MPVHTSMLHVRVDDDLKARAAGSTNPRLPVYLAEAYLKLRQPKEAERELRAVLAGIGKPDDVYALSGLPFALPTGTYRLSDAGIALDPIRTALGWGLGAYRFAKYRKSARDAANLSVDAGTLRAVGQFLDGIYSHFSRYR